MLQGLLFQKSKCMSKIRTELTGTFDEVLQWFDVAEDKLYGLPANGGWSIARILEHISLTNDCLLILIRKGAIKSLERSRDENYRALVEGYTPDWEKLELIGQPDAFQWERPAHMEPSGDVALEDVKKTLLLQEEECLALLDQLKDGEGLLCTTTMSVNNLGKLDVYPYVYFLVQHARRHIEQMQKIV
jgi:hypothetical protein